jgi:hypothetical protein
MIAIGTFARISTDETPDGNRVVPAEAQAADSSFGPTGR